MSLNGGECNITIKEEEDQVKKEESSEGDQLKQTFSNALKTQLIELRTKFALSLFLLCILFIEALIRRIEEIVRNSIQTSAV